MSASNKKKLRKEQEAARMTERQKAEQKEAKKLKAYTWTFCIAIALCVCIVLGMVLQSPVNTLIERTGTSVTIGEHKLDHTELNYFYIDAINQYCNEYASYLSYLINVSVPLDEQVIDQATGKTWADNFEDMAIANAKNTYALYDAAKAAGYSLPSDERKTLNELYDSMDDFAKEQGFSSASKYLQAVYGKSASEKSYKEYYEVTILAQSYYSSHAEDLRDAYKPADLRAFEKDKEYEYNSYSYASFYLSVDKFKTGGTKDDKGNITYSDAEIKAAEEACKSAALALAVKENNTVEKLNEAIKQWEIEQEALKPGNNTKPIEKPTESTPTEATKPSEAPTEPSEPVTEPSAEASEPTDESTKPTEPSKEDDKDEDDKKEEEKKYSTCTEQDDVLYTKISSIMQEWLRDTARKNGDITALPYETTSTDKDGKEVKTLKGYYVVLYLSTNDNTYALANVRHILVSFEGGTKNNTTGETTYSAAEKAAAKAKAEKLLDEWKKGAATEDSFAELAKKNSTDPGSKDNGGLYEDVYPGQMVTNFNDWCFDEARKPGDTGIVESDYGYHIMYYVSDSETNYRDYMVENALLSSDMEKWSTGLNDAVKVEVKNTKHLPGDKSISQILYTGNSSSNDGHDH